MAKQRVGGKWAYVKVGKRHNYKFVGILPNGKKVVGVLAQGAESKEDVPAIARQMGYNDVVENSIMVDSKFQSITGNYSDATVKSWSADEWKRKTKSKSPSKKA